MDKQDTKLVFDIVESFKIVENVDKWINIFWILDDDGEEDFITFAEWQEDSIGLEEYHDYKCQQDWHDDQIKFFREMMEHHVIHSSRFHRFTKMAREQKLLK